MHAGIDYGSKLAGTTAICWAENHKIRFGQSQKKKDADQFIQDWAAGHSPKHIYIDAPLSLPGVYTSIAGCSDYFYRAADKALNAMSPMFLGGLTARAMRMKQQLQDNGIEVWEAYPGGLARQLPLDAGRYKKDNAYLTAASLVLAELTGLEMPEPPKNWHQFDAGLAFLIGQRRLNGTAEPFGQEAEGFIWV